MDLSKIKKKKKDLFVNEEALKAIHTLHMFSEDIIIF